MTSPSNNSNIWSLIRFTMAQWKDLSMQYSVPYKQPLRLFVLVKIIFGDCLKKRTLINHPNNLRLMVHQTATCLHTLSAASYGPHETPESGKWLSSWCSVDSSSHTGLSFGQLQSVVWEQSLGYHSHQGPYSVTMCVVLGFALAGQLV